MKNFREFIIKEFNEDPNQLGNPQEKLNKLGWEKFRSRMIDFFKELGREDEEINSLVSSLGSGIDQAVEKDNIMEPSADGNPTPE